MFLNTVDLLGLLRWQEVMNDQTLLKKHLEQLMKVDGEEIVKVKHYTVISQLLPALYRWSLYLDDHWWQGGYLYRVAIAMPGLGSTCCLIHDVD